MNADAGAPDGAIMPINQALQNSYPRSSAFIRGKSSCLRHTLAFAAGQAGPAQHPATLIDSTAPPFGIAAQNRRRNPYAQSARRSPRRWSVLPTQPRAPRRTHPPVAHPATPIPPNRICPPQPVHPEKPPPNPTTQPAMATRAVRQPASLRRNAVRPEKPPPHPAGQPTQPANPHPPAATPCAQRNRPWPPAASPRAPRPLRWIFLPPYPTRPNPTRPSPHPAMLLRTIPPCTSPQTGPYLASSLP
jgi:hypothetical protein